MLKRCSRAIKWTIIDNIEIHSSICYHKLQILQDYKLSIENNRRLNPTMQEVVKKEIIKWLDAGAVYSIENSCWVCLVQCVPKNGGIIVGLKKISLF